MLIALAVESWLALFNMTTKQHTRRHALLHAALDELVADWINHRGLANQNFFTQDITLKDFIKWSGKEATQATPLINTAGEDISGFQHSKPSKSRRIWNLPLYPLRGANTSIARSATNEKP